jgi:hypothetical protein
MRFAAADLESSAQYFIERDHQLCIHAESIPGCQDRTTASRRHFRGETCNIRFSYQRLDLFFQGVFGSMMLQYSAISFQH